MANEKNDGAIKANIYAEQPGAARSANTVTISLPPEEDKEASKEALDKLNSRMIRKKKKHKMTQAVKMHSY